MGLRVIEFRLDDASQYIFGSKIYYTYVPKGAMFMQFESPSLGVYKLRFLADINQETEMRTYAMLLFGTELELKKGYPSFVGKCLDDVGAENFLFEIHNENFSKLF